MLSNVLFLLVIAGCNSDIVRNKKVKLDSPKSVYIEPLKTEDTHIGLVLRDVIEKEFVRSGFALNDSNSATILISGTAFLTERSKSSGNFVLFLGGSSAKSTSAIESVSLVAKNRSGQIIATASFDNSESFTASRLATEFGHAFSNSLKK
jgi:fluoride ion exporter CrcB/FEX